MILNEKEAAARLNSPMNLMNRLRETSKTNDRRSAMSLFIPATQKKENKLDKLNKLEHDEIVVSFNPFSTKVSSALVTPENSSQVLSSQSERLDDVLEDHEAKIELGLAHDKAIKLLNRSVDMLSAKLDDVSASKLPQVISAASKTIESIRKERYEVAKSGKDREVHYHFYTPEQKKVTDYQIIDV